MIGRSAVEERIDVLHIAYGGLGGHAPVIVTLANSLSHLGIRTGVIAYAGAAALRENLEAWASLPVVRPIEMNGRVDFAAWREVYDSVLKFRPRVVLCHNHKFVVPVKAAVLANRSRSTHSLLVEHQAIDLRGWSDNLHSIIALPLVDAVVLLSADYKKRYPFRRLPLPSIDHTVVIPNGVDTCDFSPLQGGLNRSEFRVGMASRLTATKDVATLIRAVRELRRIENASHVHLEVAGTGPYLAECRTLVKSLHLGESVTFVGHVPPAEIGAFYRGLDAYVQSTYGETASTAILQAMATGLPVVGSDVMGVRDLIQHNRTGLLVPPQNSSAMASAINLLRSNEALRLQLGKAGRADVIARFSAQSSASAYLQLFASIDPAGPWHREKQAGQAADSPISP